MVVAVAVAYRTFPFTLTFSFYVTVEQLGGSITAGDTKCRSTRKSRSCRTVAGAVLATERIIFGRLQSYNRRRSGTPSGAQVRFNNNNNKCFFFSLIYYYYYCWFFLFVIGYVLSPLPLPPVFVMGITKEVAAHSLSLCLLSFFFNGDR